MIKLAIIAALVAPLAACNAGQGAGLANVAVSSIKIVCLSRADTQSTKEQVSQNNAALAALGAPKPDCKSAPAAAGAKVGATFPTS